MKGALSTALFGANPGLNTEVTLWPCPTQVQVTVPPAFRTTVSGLNDVFRTSTVAADTGEGGGGGGGGPGGGDGA